MGLRLRLGLGLRLRAEKWKAAMIWLRGGGGVQPAVNDEEI
jgi:hypothetical protein